MRNVVIDHGVEEPAVPLAAAMQLQAGVVASAVPEALRLQRAAAAVPPGVLAQVDRAARAVSIWRRARSAKRQSTS